MNKVILMGRLTKDPDIRYTQGEDATAIGRYTLAVERRSKRENEATADFISCAAFGKMAEFAEKYLRKGVKIAVVGRIRTGSYTNRDGVKVYTTEILVDEQEFAESKGSSENAAKESNHGSRVSAANNDGFMNIPDGIDDELPFS